MGAHGLGGAIRNQSGYEGAWTPGRDTLFNNELYQIMDEDIDKFYNGVILIINSLIFEFIKHLSMKISLKPISIII